MKAKAFEVPKVFLLSCGLGWILGVLSLVYWFERASDQVGIERPTLSTYLLQMRGYQIGFALFFACLATPAYFAYMFFNRRNR